MSSLYSNIKCKRLELGLTQEQLAQKLGYKNKSTIAKIEAGKSDLPQSKISEFAKALCTIPSQLMGWEGTANNVALQQPTADVNKADFLKLPIINDKAVVLRMLSQGQRTIALEIADEYMYPEYFNGDTVFIQAQEAYTNGDECAIVCSRKKQILVRKIIFAPGKITLQPINTNYQPVSYKYPGQVIILGRVIELRRKK